METRPVKISERLRTATRLFLDTPPIVYYVEKDPRYLSRVDTVFDQLDAGRFSAVTCPITLAECLVVPLRKGQKNLQAAFTDLVVNGNNVAFVALDDEIGCQAADLRARYNLSLTDSFQAAAALSAKCDAFLTNDPLFKRVNELNVIVLDEMESEQTGPEAAK